jgi:hypothetical protein
VAAGGERRAAGDSAAHGISAISATCCVLACCLLPTLAPVAAITKHDTSTTALHVAATSVNVMTRLSISTAPRMHLPSTTDGALPA